MVPARVRLGELLVEAQIVSRAQLEEVLSSQKRDGRRIGTLLVEAGLVTETQVTQILSQQLSVPWVSLYHIDFSRQLLNLVSQELAEKYCLVPIFVRRVRGLGETLYVAMDDPSDEAAQREVGQWAGLPVRAMIAPPTDIRSAIRVYYGVGKDTASLSEAVAEVDAETSAVGRAQTLESKAKTSPPAAPPSILDPVDASPPSSDSTPVHGRLHVLPPQEAPAVERASLKPAQVTFEDPGLPISGQRPASHPPAAAVSAPPPEGEEAAPDSSPKIEAREISMPAPRKGGGRMVTLTLLDGTKVNLPARETAGQKKARPIRKSSRPPGDANELTARDLIAALRAVSHGADATEILGDNVHWEALFSALLSLLLKKHLIADWEFVEEYKKV